MTVKSDAWTHADREEACRAGRVVHDNGVIEAWLYSPQVGGSWGVMRVRTEPSRAATGDACFDVTIWHDGEFAHRGAEDDPSQTPITVHGCSPLQWLQAAARIAWLQGITPDECVDVVREAMDAEEGKVGA